MTEVTWLHSYTFYHNNAAFTSHVKIPYEASERSVCRQSVAQYRRLREVLTH